MRILPFSELNARQKKELCEVMYDSFREELHLLLFRGEVKHPIYLLENFLSFEYGFYALQYGKPVGLVSLSDFQHGSVYFRFKAFREELGFKRALRLRLNAFEFADPLPRRGELKIEYLAVQEQYRNQGVATELLKETILEAKRRHLKRLFFDVLEENVRAYRLYRDLGFQTAGILEVHQGMSSFIGEKNYLMEMRFSKDDFL